MASWAPQVEPDVKPVKRHKATAAEWTQIRAQFAGQCCVSCGLGDNLELHHICPRSHSGDDVVENLCVLCRICHGKLEAHEDGWERVAAAVRVYVLLHRPRCAYVIGKIGWERFNSRYPLLSEPECSQPSPGREWADSSRVGSGSESDEKPRVGAWDIDFLPPFNSEDIPFA